MILDHLFFFFFFLITTNSITHFLRAYSEDQDQIWIFALSIQLHFTTSLVIGQTQSQTVLYSLKKTNELHTKTLESIYCGLHIQTRNPNTSAPHHISKTFNITNKKYTMVRYNIPSILSILTTTTLSFFLSTITTTPFSSSSSSPSIFANAQQGEIPQEVIDIRYGAWTELGRGIGEENEGDLTGYSVASSAEGTIVAIGAPKHTSTYGKHAGRVRVYEYNQYTDTWRKLGSDIVGDVGDESGFSVALSITGEFLAVGAPKCSVLQKNQSTGKREFIKKEAGCVRVYERTIELGDEGNNIWEKLGDTLTGQDAFDHFGYDVAINDIYTAINEQNEDLDMVQVAIGAPGAKSALDQIVGRAYLKEFVIDGTENWVDASLNGDGDEYVGEGTPGSEFGSSVSLSIDNDLMLVGAPKANENIMDGFTIRSAGKVMLFERKMDSDDKQRWRDVSKITFYGDEEGNECGRSVSMTLRGTYIAFGCPMASYYDMQDTFIREAGQVLVYKIEFKDGEWTWQAAGSNEVLGENAGDYFGTSISLGEDAEYDVDNIFLAVGAPNNYPSSTKQKAGHVRVYHLKEYDWRRANLDIDGLNAFDEFGTSVSVSYDGHRVIAGAPGQSGYAKIYDLKYTEAPTPVPTFTPTKTGRRRPIGGGNPTSNKPPHKMEDLIYDRNNRTRSSLLLGVLFLVMIPAMIFLVFKGYLYWRGRRSYNSDFGADVHVATPSDLELSRSVNAAPGADGTFAQPLHGMSSSGTGEVTRDII